MAKALPLERDYFSGHTYKMLGVETKDSRLSLTYFSAAFISLFIVGFLVLFQGLERAGFIELPAFLYYYHMLTADDLLLLLVFTSTFLIGYFYSSVSHKLVGLLPAVRKMGWIAFRLIVFGVLTAVTQIVKGEATVLYSFYPPMKASP